MAPQGPLPSAFNVADRDVADKEAAQMFYAVVCHLILQVGKRIFHYQPKYTMKLKQHCSRSTKSSAAGNISQKGRPKETDNHP
ncbi:unnamed protein product [Ilex paraguariensis]|uniref:Uncharacterized protein n=1 Tax=Ilex paraguariensis TaxID=185542 RepID=A0ABC8RN82_9AQUA